MSLLDWAIVVVLLGVALSGFWKGAVRLCFGVGGVVLGTWLAFVAGPELAVWLTPRVGAQWLATVLGWLLPALLCISLCLVAGWGLDKTLRALHLGWINRALGAAIAGTVGAIFIGLVLLTAVRFSPTWSGICAKSVLVPPFLGLIQPLAQLGPEPTQPEAVPAEPEEPEAVPAEPEEPLAD